MLERESRIRDIGYGAMITEMMVALMAMIAACVLEPGEYFAINTKGTPTEVVAKVSAAGFAVTEQQMRSEEHTSELQSLRHLVCRLLLEKKKKKNKCRYRISKTHSTMLVR